jgi:hypothetical protein
MKRTILPVVLVAFFALSAASAWAQLGIYGEYSAPNVPGDAFLGTKTAWYEGFTGGVYDDFLHAGPIGVGLDLRGGYAKANINGTYNVLFGPRLAVKVPVLPFRPFIQGSIGFGGVKSSPGPGNSTHYTGRLQYGLIGGLDFTLIPHLDLRLPEIEYIRTSDDQFSGPAAPVNLVTISAGLVLRLP